MQKCSESGERVYQAYWKTRKKVTREQGGKICVFKEIEGITKLKYIICKVCIMCERIKYAYQLATSLFGPAIGDVYFEVSMQIHTCTHI